MFKRWLADISFDPVVVISASAKAVREHARNEYKRADGHAADLLKRVKDRFVFQETESATRSSNLAKTSTTQSTNARTLAFRCRLEGYMTWIG